MSNELSRRQFFRLAPSDLVMGMARAPTTDGQPSPIRPPGALEEERFLAACEHCPHCSEACPYGVIHHLGAAAGQAEGTPALDPEESPCQWCETMDCIRACRTGALRLADEGGRPEPIAVAKIEFEKCLVSEGVLCDTCVHYCPSGIRGIQLVNRSPKVDTQVCVGCGLCSAHCSASESAIRILPLEKR